MEAGLKQISSRELSEWQVYASQYGPLRSDDRADWRIARLTAVLFNLWRGKKTKPAKASDFVPEWGKPAAQDETQTADHMLTIIEQLNAAFGGRDLRG